MSLNTSAWSRRRERANHRLFFLRSPHLCFSVCFSESRCDMTAGVSIMEEKRTNIALSAALLCPLSTPQVSYIGSSLLLSGWTHTSRCAHTCPGGGGFLQQHFHFVFADVIRSKWTRKELQNYLQRPLPVLLILPDGASEAT